MNSTLDTMHDWILQILIRSNLNTILTVILFLLSTSLVVGNPGEWIHIIPESEMENSANINISGHVMDESGEPLIGVNILVVGSDAGTSTDLNGDFQLEDVDENAQLQVSYIGFQTQIVEMNGRSEVTITLLEDRQTLDEVVIIGYGTQKKPI